MFPDSPQSEYQRLVEISWDEFFGEPDPRKRVLLFEADSLFTKLVGQDRPDKCEHGDRHAARHA